MACLSHFLLPSMRQANGLSRLRGRIFVIHAAMPVLYGRSLRHCTFTPASHHVPSSGSILFSTSVPSSSVAVSAAATTISSTATAPAIVSVGDAALTPGRLPFAAACVNSHSTSNEHASHSMMCDADGNASASHIISTKSTKTDRCSDESLTNETAKLAPTPIEVNSSTAAASAEDHPYALWEIRALVLALLPPYDRRVSRGLTDKDVLYMLPKAVRQQLMRCEEGGLMGYIRRHMSQDVITQGRSIWRSCDSSSRSGDEVGTTTGNDDASASSESSPSVSSSSSSADRSSTADVQKRSKFVTQTNVVEMLVPYLPTYYVPVRKVEAQLPEEIVTLYAGTTFAFFVRRLRNYVQIRSEHGHVDIRLRPDFDHPRRGEADRRYRAALSSSFDSSSCANSADGMASDAYTSRRDSSPGDDMNAMTKDNSASFLTIRRPVHNSEAGLIALIVPRLPTEYTPLAEVLRDITDVASRHAAFDPRLGIRGLFEKYPEYIQIVEGKLRVRPYRCAPNAIAEYDLAHSPLPAVFARLLPLLERAADGVRYEVAAEKAAAMVPTGRLYAMLTQSEKATMKTSFRSFPRFLRMHGKELVVSVDNMRVYKFRPEHEPCADTLIDQRLWLNTLSLDDPIRKIPAEMSESTQAEWAVRELYDALPLTQCVELQEVLSLVPASMRQALPAEESALLAQLARFPEYFATWPYPDNMETTMVQRAKVDIPVLDDSEIIRLVLPLLPPGGTELATVMRRSPLHLQRYFHRHGLVTTLSKFTDYVMISGDRIVRVRR